MMKFIAILYIIELVLIIRISFPFETLKADSGCAPLYGGD
jgi:hypothetical protein